MEILIGICVLPLLEKAICDIFITLPVYSLERSAIGTILTDESNFTSLINSSTTFASIIKLFRLTIVKTLVADETILPGV